MPVSKRFSGRFHRQRHSRRGGPLQRESNYFKSRASRSTSLGSQFIATNGFPLRSPRPWSLRGYEACGNQSCSDEKPPVRRIPSRNRGSHDDNNTTSEDRDDRLKDQPRTNRVQGLHATPGTAFQGRNVGKVCRARVARCLTPAAKPHTTRERTSVRKLRTSRRERRRPVSGVLTRSVNERHIADQWQHCSARAGRGRTTAAPSRDPSPSLGRQHRDFGNRPGAQRDGANSGYSRGTGDLCAGGDRARRLLQQRQARPRSQSSPRRNQRLMGLLRVEGSSVTGVGLWS